MFMVDVIKMKGWCVRMKIKCYDAARMVLDEATKQFAPLFDEDAGKVLKLKGECEYIERIADAFGGVSYEIEVNPENFDIKISVSCQDKVIVRSEGIHRSGAKYIDVSIDEDGGDNLICLTFVFDGVWSVCGF